MRRGQTEKGAVFPVLSPRLKNTEGEPCFSEELLKDRSVLAFPLLLAVVASFLVSLGHSPYRQALPVAQPSADARKQPAPSQVAAQFAQLPLRFEANEGQTDSQVKYLARGRGYTLFLTADAAVLALQKPASAGSKRASIGSDPQDGGNKIGVLQHAPGRRRSKCAGRGPGAPERHQQLFFRKRSAPVAFQRGELRPGALSRRLSRNRFGLLRTGRGAGIRFCGGAGSRSAKNRI